MATQLHDRADPLQQCGYCTGWTHEDLWRRIELVGDEDTGVLLRCKECGYQGQDLAYLGWHHLDGEAATYVTTVAELLAIGERHVVEHHGPSA